MQVGRERLGARETTSRALRRNKCCSSGTPVTSCYATGIPIGATMLPSDVGRGISLRRLTRSPPFPPSPAYFNARLLTDSRSCCLFATLRGIKPITRSYSVRIVPMPAARTLTTSSHENELIKRHCARDKPSSFYTPLLLLPLLRRVVRARVYSRADQLAN